MGADAADVDVASGVLVGIVVVPLLTSSDVEQLTMLVAAIAMAESKIRGLKVDP
ncbi:hypothetical protein [Nocardia thailandica]